MLLPCQKVRFLLNHKIKVIDTVASLLPKVVDYSASWPKSWSAINP